MFKSRKVREEDSWDGVVVDKTRRNTDGSNLYHYAEIRFPDGATKKVRIDKTLWEAVAVGDRLVKEAGAAQPVKG
ncbi:DUF7489 domain-containing protein [Streptomyces beihaiensis]|uniref:DUF7489 domain-containing protein n=1 Tax=Streptomyces beihaiensis TaxID=2984495 RepID=A0ABT3U4Z3_9ACTN|nr:hypothetical protein [Streptomyces beihaiensis]MCX3063295.1 hypothetical protein [Streptomyces beihaiensis]